MALLGLLGQNQNQNAQNQLTLQQQAQMQQVAQMLQQKGENKDKEQFTSPWQVAGQWAQALGGQQMQNQLGQGYSALNQTQQLTPTNTPTTGPDTGIPGTDSLPWSGGQ